jgi:hypothetical protein
MLYIILSYDLEYLLKDLSEKKKKADADTPYFWILYFLIFMYFWPFRAYLASVNSQGSRH